MTYEQVLQLIRNAQRPRSLAAEEISGKYVAAMMESKTYDFRAGEELGEHDLEAMAENRN